jgi:sugar/nucleoside kinase (ribokinase family)
LGACFANVIVKRGRLGAVLGGRDGIRLDLPAPSVTVRDSTGAGDAFAAGFIAAFLDGQDEATAMQAGIAAGARAVQVIGGQPQDGGGPTAPAG